jgi:hypothetical protein
MSSLLEVIPVSQLTCTPQTCTRSRRERAALSSRSLPSLSLLFLFFLPFLHTRN